MHTPPALVAFSHLRWGFVHQRPQHLLSRLAQHWRVWFVEEPVPCDGAPWLESRKIDDQLTVLVPHSPVDAPGFHARQMPVLSALLASFFAAQRIHDALAWFYTPMALPLLDAVPHRCVVYDCMDELSAFKGAPRELHLLEAALLKRAALVIAGGPSLHEAKRRLHRNAHGVPSSVDARHFSPASLDRNGAAARHVDALQGALARPRLGFFGVIDERLDTALLAALADAHPEWQVVMVGPIVKIDPQALPRRPNLHWLGMQSYEHLPHFLAGWDVCLMPFALNESTRFISPTKTLEYMAGGKPVVSTPVADVVTLYGHAVEVASGTAAFVRACEDVLAEAAPERSAARAARRKTMQRTVAQHSWDRSAAQVHELLLLAWRQARSTADASAPALSTSTAAATLAATAAAASEAPVLGVAGLLGAAPA